MQKGASLRPGQGYTGLLRNMDSKEITTEEWKQRKKEQRARFTALQNLPYEVKIRRQALRAYQLLCIYGIARRIGKYRDIGTLEEVREAVKELKLYKDAKLCLIPEDVFSKQCEEVDAYRELGTLEEIRDAVKRQHVMKPILHMNEMSGMFVDYADGRGEYKTQTNNWWRCPCCNSIVGERVIIRGKSHDQRKKRFCNKCGQHIDWSEEI